MDREGLVALHAVVLNGVDGEGGFEIVRVEVQPLPDIGFQISLSHAHVPEVKPVVEIHVVVARKSRRWEGGRCQARRHVDARQARPGLVPS